MHPSRLWLSWLFLFLLAIWAPLIQSSTSNDSESSSVADNNQYRPHLRHGIVSSMSYNIPTQNPVTLSPSAYLISQSERNALLEMLRCWPTLAYLSDKPWDGLDIDNACIRGFYGLTCELTSEGQFMITGINLNWRWRMQMELAGSLDGLTNLRTLKIDRALLYSDTLEKLLVPSLTDISLVGVQTSFPPQAATRLTKLENLEIIDCSGFSDLPSFNRSSQLKYLQVSNNTALTHWNSTATTSYRKLETIMVSNNPLLQSFPTFSNTSSLRTIHILGNGIESLYGSFTNCSAIQELVLVKNPSLKFLPRALAQASSLTSLDLSSNNLAYYGSLDGLAGMRLTHLSLEDNNITSMPSGFCSLYRFTLTSISLANNFLSSIPTCVGNYYNLHNLNLSSAGPVSYIPDQIFALSWLESLDLSLLTSLKSLPSSLANMWTLKTLSLRDCNLSMPFPEAWFSSSEFWLFGSNPLENLYFSGNRFNGSLAPDFFSQLLNLVVFDVSGSHLQGDFPPLVVDDEASAELPLTSIIVSGNFFESIPDSIANLTQLEVLDFSHNKLSSIPKDETWLSLDKIRNFSVADNRLLSGQPLPKWWSNSSSLVSIDLSRCGFTGTIPEVISPQLSMLAISENRLTGSLNLVSMPSSLIHLNISHNQLIGLRATGSLGVWRSFNLTILDVSFNRFKGSIPRMAYLKDTLQVLFMQNNEFEGPLPSLGPIRNLGHLDLSNNRLDLCGADPDVKSLLHLAPITCRLSSSSNDSVCACQEWYQRCRIGTVCLSAAPSISTFISIGLVSLLAIVVTCTL